MIKAPIGLQELRRRIYRKAKSDNGYYQDLCNFAG
jgi:hypothetical protein